ncbi:MAG: hypothetical protein M9894_15770 [Planctomycetes bacterium]|nr:hypothetical protein [Planctomycetota bacterium]
MNGTRGVVRAWVDREGDPSVPAIHVWIARVTDGSVASALNAQPAHGKIVGLGQELVLKTAQASFGSFSYPTGSQDGGERITGPTEASDVRVLDVTIAPKPATPGRALVTFKVDAKPDTSIFRASVWWGVPGGHQVRATLVGVTGGTATLDGAYVVVDVEHDVAYTVEWDLEADELDDDEEISVQVRVARTSSA